MGGVSLRASRFISLLIVLTACQTVLAQQSNVQPTFIDTIANYSEIPISRDSLYHLFLARQDNLSEDIKDSSYKLLREEYSGLRSSTAFNFTLVLSQSGSVSDQIALWRYCTRYIRTQKPLDTLELCKSLNYYGGALHAKGRIPVAKAQFLEVISLLPPGTIDEELAVAHNNLGAILNSHNDPGGALPNYIRARDIFIELIGSDHYYIGIINNNIGQVYSQLGDYDKQIEVQLKCLDIYPGSIGRVHALTANAHLNLGIGYRNNDNRAEALYHLNEALDIREQLGDKQGVIAALSEIASCQAAFPDYYTMDEIGKGYLTVIERGRALLDSNSTSLISAYNNYGLHLIGTEQYAEALRYVRKSITLANADFRTIGEFTIPTVTSIGVPTFHDARMLENQAYILNKLFEETSELKYADASYETYVTGDSIIEIMKSQLLNGLSREQLINEAGDYYINAASGVLSRYYSTYSMSDLAKSHEWVEKSRNWELMTRYMTNRNRQSVLADSILLRIGEVQSQLPSTYTGSAPESDSLNQLNDVLVEQLKLQHPEYFRHFYNHSTTPLDSLAMFCSRHDVQWLQFFLLSGGRFGSIFITPDTMVVMKAPGDLDTLRHYREQLTSRILEKSWAFTTSAQRIYKEVFEPYESVMKSGEIYVSAAGLLDNVPFDILIPSETDPQIEELADHYFVRNHTVSLIPSVSFGLETFSDDRTIRTSTFIAPEYNENTLRYSGSEAKTGSDVLSGTYVTSEVDRDYFVRSMGKADLIHFAGHSFSHPESFDSIYLLLEFERDTVFFSDLLELESAANLAVLSSCHSATGKPTREGNLGLAYGFALAGTPNIVSSLWSATDREAQFLFEKFYMNLREGSSSVASLRNAKLQYLTESPVPGRHPYYWANWTYHGHPVTYVGKDRRVIIWVGVLTILSMIVALRFLNQRKARNNS